MPEEEAWPLGGKVKYSKEVHIMPQQLRRNMKAKDCKNKVSSTLKGVTRSPSTMTKPL
jgi:hypothetical protein